MITQQAQIKLNLPLPLKKFLENKAAKFGMPVASYVKHLILKDVADVAYPVFEASPQTIEAYKKAIEEKAEAKEVKDIDKFFKKL
jgi:hypothetical protein